MKKIAELLRELANEFEKMDGKENTGSVSLAQESAVIAPVSPEASAPPPPPPVPSVTNKEYSVPPPPMETVNKNEITHFETVEEFNDALAKLATEQGTPVHVYAVLSERGVENVDDLDPSLWSDVYDAVKALG